MIWWMDFLIWCKFRYMSNTRSVFSFFEQSRIVTYAMLTWTLWTSPVNYYNFFIITTILKRSFRKPSSVPRKWAAKRHSEKKKKKTSSGRYFLSTVMAEWLRIFIFCHLPQLQLNLTLITSSLIYTLLAYKWEPNLKDMLVHSCFNQDPANLLN